MASYCRKENKTKDQATTYDVQEKRGVVFGTDDWEEYPWWKSEEEER